MSVVAKKDRWGPPQAPLCHFFSCCAHFSPLEAVGVLTNYQKNGNHHSETFPRAPS